MISIGRSLFFSLLTASVVAREDTLRPSLERALAPEEAGAIHTNAFEALADLHRARRPKNRTELRSNVNAVSISYLCGDDADPRSECATGAAATTRARFERPVSPRRWTVPDDLRNNPVLEETLSAILPVVDALRMTGDDNNVDDVLDDLDRLTETVLRLKDDGGGDDDDHDPVHKAIVLGGLSIAAESTKLWNEVYRDPEHVLHGLHHYSYYHDDSDRRLRSRALQQTSNITKVILSDVMAGVDGGLEAYRTNADNVFSDPVTVVTSVIVALVGDAIIASAAAFLNDDFYDGEDR